jgi:CheY-like chemotaxis protein
MGTPNPADHVSDPASSAGQRTVLIIDDQHSVRVSLSFSLEYHGYRVLTAESGPAAIALAETELFDAALIDVHMPGMNGFDACAVLQSKTSAQGRSPRFWFMTGVCTSDVERRCKELGALGVFRKPFDFPSFLQSLESGFVIPPSGTAPLPAMSCAAVADDPSPSAP